MQDRGSHLRNSTRRYFLRDSGLGLGAIALSGLLGDEACTAGQPQPSMPLAPKPPQFAPQVKNVIFLFMAGGPSHVDLFDHKPTLTRWNGQPAPQELTQGERFAFIKGAPSLLGSPYKFQRHGQSGVELSTLLPHLASVADEISILRSVHTDEFNHGPAQIYMNAGHGMGGRPSLGSWLTYGLGSENSDLPGFVVLLSGNAAPDAGPVCWGNGFLPSSFQGVQLLSKGDPVQFLSNPEGVSASDRRATLDLLGRLNQLRLTETGDDEIAARIASYEMGYRMQTSVPELMDVAGESSYTHAQYGTQPGVTSFANNCLLARRLVERGVRFVQLYHRGWDHHGTSSNDDLLEGLPKLCKEVDQASAALINDLKDRGLLDSTLVVWGGEFGRTPMWENREVAPRFLGRDHHPRAFSMWVSGGGVKSGITVGQTDDFGYHVAANPIHVHDLHATILHLLGIDHSRLTYRLQGRDFRLTDVSGQVVKELLA